MTSGTRPGRATVAAQSAYVFDLKLAGMTVRAISAAASTHFGYYIGPSTVQERIQKACAELVNPRVEELRKVEVARLDRYLASLDQKVMEGDQQSINTALRVSERRAKMLGIDMPLQLEVKHTVVTSVDDELEKLAAELGLADPTLAPVEMAVQVEA
jgi:hypothetical protein